MQVHVRYSFDKIFLSVWNFFCERDTLFSQKVSSQMSDWVLNLPVFYKPVLTNSANIHKKLLVPEPFFDKIARSRSANSF